MDRIPISQVPIKGSCLASMLMMLTELECDITAELH